MTDIVDPASLSRTSIDAGYPTPPEMDQNSPKAEESSKKKRKAWGQVVPKFNQVLPPRKRAKTDEEKEQRRAERILRNRKAADKSRQRQKAAVAKLEVKTSRMLKENASLRDALLRYQSLFGDVDGITIPPVTEDEDNDEAPQQQPQAKEDVAPTPRDDSPYPSEYTTDSPHPILVKSEPEYDIHMTFGDPASQSSFDDQNQSLFPDNFFSSPNPYTDLAHYSAEIMYDPQCPKSVIGPKLERMLSKADKHRCLSIMLQIIHYLLIGSKTFCTITLWPMYQMFQIMEHSSQMSFVENVYQSILKNFPSIHTLISMPSTTTRPAVFRLKLLSKLLTCSPQMSQLLLAATSGALEEVVSRDGFAEDADSRWNFSSLMAIKWSIMRLEIEHRRIRQRGRQQSSGKLDQCEDIMDGVDKDGVLENRHLWEGEAQRNCTKIDESPNLLQEAY